MIETLVAVDPGKRSCGVAVFEQRRLTQAWLARIPRGGGADLDAVALLARQVLRTLCTTSVTEILLEWPQIYQGGKQKGDPNDLLFLAGLDGAIVSALPYAHATAVRPRDWKGTTDPDIVCARIKQIVQEAGESAIIQWPCASLEHNVLDAIGIGLWHLGRLHQPTIRR